MTDFLLCFTLDIHEGHIEKAVNISCKHIFGFMKTKTVACHLKFNKGVTFIVVVNAWV